MTQDIVGKLREFAKPGDLVELVKNGIIDGQGIGVTGTVVVKKGRYYTEGGMRRGDISGHVFRLISRASDTPRTWGEMTDAEKAALLLAAHEGKVIQCNWLDKSGWFDVEHPKWDPTRSYRIAPPKPKREPKRETVELYFENSGGVYCFAGNKHRVTDTHLITFTTLDGKPDLASIKMEEL